MSALRTGFVEVPGARLYYEVDGDGPALIVVPGAAGCAEPYRRLAAEFADRYTVVVYDRRGLSRSTLVGDQDDERRLDVDADDAVALAADVVGEPVTLFGNSSGAIVTLHTLIRHPSVIRRVIAHEPPLMTELGSEGDEWIDFFISLYDLYRASGPRDAMERFAERTFAEVDRLLVAKAPTNEYSSANSAYWFEHELRQYPAVRLDHEALRRSVDRIVLATGRESRDHPCRRATEALAQSLERKVVELPGGHLGFVGQPREFALALTQLASSERANLT